MSRAFEQPLYHGTVEMIPRIDVTRGRFKKDFGRGLYTDVQKKIAEAITMDQPVILDTGCGEGSHLVKICEQLQNATGIGIDIAKEGIVSAAKFHREQIWCVGDLAKRKTS